MTSASLAETILDSSSIRLIQWLYLNDADAFNKLHYISQYPSSLMNSHGLSCLIYDKLNQLSHIQDTDDIKYIKNNIKNDYYSLVAKDLFYQSCLEQTIQFLDKNNIKYILLKGAALSLFAYSKSYHRSKGDIDLIVAKEHYKTLNTLYEKMGFKASLDMNEEYTSHYQSQYKVFHHKPTGISISLDIHFDLSHHPVFKNQLNFEELEMNSQTIVSNHVKYVTLNLEYSIIHNIIHLFGHHLNEVKLIWLIDTYRLLSKLNHQQWLNLVTLSQHKNISGLLIHTLVTLKTLTNDNIFRSEIMGIKAYKILLKLYQNNAFDKEKSYLLIRNLHLSETKRRFKSIKGVFNKIKWLRQNILPSPLYMKQRYHCNNIFQLIKAYAVRLLAIKKHL